MRKVGNRMSKGVWTRREFVAAGAVGVAGLALPELARARAKQKRQSEDWPLREETDAADTWAGIRFGIASYTFRNFTRAQTIEFLKKLNVNELNAKDTKDHLP